MQVSKSKHVPRFAVLKYVHVALEWMYVCQRCVQINSDSYGHVTIRKEIYSDVFWCAWTRDRTERDLFRYVLMYLDT